MIELINNIKLLVSNLNQIYNEMVVKSVKDKELRPLLKMTEKAKNSTISLLENIQNLEVVNPNIFICYENNVYLTVINKEYVIGLKEDEEDNINILATEKDLKTALKKFYKYAYKEKL